MPAPTWRSGSVPGNASRDTLRRLIKTARKAPGRRRGGRRLLAAAIKARAAGRQLTEAELAPFDIRRYGS
jgi:hypothetical protein